MYIYMHRWAPVGDEQVREAYLLTYTYLLTHTHIAIHIHIHIHTCTGGRLWEMSRWGRR